MTYKPTHLSKDETVLLINSLTHNINTQLDVDDDEVLILSQNLLNRLKSLKESLDCHQCGFTNEHLCS